MSELSTNQYPKLFNPMEKYFPGGLLDYKGNKVINFLNEFKAISLEGRNILSAWLMAPDHDHKCYSPCSAKKSYVSYMKRDIEMMSDAGAGGLHIDEYDTQKHVLQNAGCFCDECMDNFRHYIAEHHIPLPADAGDITNFDYRQYLLEKGYKDKDLVGCNGNDRWKIPLFRAFTDMQMASIEMVVRELSSHIKEYSLRTRGQAMKVTANLFQCYPFSWNCKKYLDILAGEKTNIQLRQDGWYKFAFGWLNGKESCFVEDPNEYVRDMLRDIKNNIHDRFILFALEPLAHGFHVSFPYGSWLQNQEKDAFWPDLRILKQLGTWLDSHETLFPKKPVADIAIIYDALSAYENFLTEPADDTIVKVEFAPDEELGKQGAFAKAGNFANFFDLIQKLSEKNVLYNVIYVSPDEPLTAQRLNGYQKIIVPDAFLLSDDAAMALSNYARTGNEVITFARAVEKLAGFKNVPDGAMKQLVNSLSEKKGMISTQECDKVGIAVHQNQNGYVLHVVNYNYNQETHRIVPVDIAFDLGFQCKQVKIHSFPENKSILYSSSNNKLELKNVGIYTIVEF